MTWIKTVPGAEASPELLRALEGLSGLLPKEYQQPVHKTAEGTPRIVAAHSLIPEALHHTFASFAALMTPDLPLSRTQHEMIATRVSVLNQCRLCSVSHVEFLRRVTLDEPLVQALQHDYEHAPITAADRVMLDYAGKITTSAVSIGPADHDRLRAHGFDDRAILQITLIASWFNYINRVADALGVGREG